MKTCEALRSAGFHSVTTIEFRLRTINYAEVQLDVPDFGSDPAATAAAAKPSGVPSATASAPTPDSSNGVAAAGALVSVEGAGAGASAEKGGNGADASGGGGAAVAADAKEAGGSSGGDGSKASEKEGLDGGGNGGMADVDDEATDNVAASGESASATKNGSASAPAAVSGSSKRPREDASFEATGEDGDVDGDGGAPSAGRGRNERLHPKAAIRAAEVVPGKGGAKKPPMKLVCAQPFPLMRGHTAFLTFATTPVARQLGIAAAGGATAAVSTGETKGGSVDGQNASLGGELEGESNHAGGGGSGGGADSGSSGGGGGGGEMDMCEEGVAGEEKSKGKGREADKPVSESACSPSVAER